MILVLVNWLFIFATLAALGLIFSFFLEKFRIVKPTLLSIDKAVLFGLVVLTTICNIISLFSPINYVINVLFSVIIITGLLSVRSDAAKKVNDWKNNIMQWHWLTKLAWLLVIFIALIKTTGPSLVDDEGGYHLPLIRWIEHFRVVPGIANIEDRLGFNPGIYMTNAYFNMTWLFRGGLYELNSFLFIIFSLSFLNGFDRLVKNNFQFIFSGIIQTSALFFLFRAYLTTMDADFIYMYSSIYLLIIFLQKIESDSLRDNDIDALLFVMLFAFVVTNKFIIGLLSPLLFWLGFIWMKDKTISFVIILLSAGCWIIGSWMIRNYFISGYLVYPLFFWDLFKPDWKVPRTVAEGQYHYVLEYAKMEITQPFNEYVNHEYPWSVWFPIWFDRIWSELLGKVIIIGTPFSILFSSYLLFFLKKQWRQDYRDYLRLLIILILITMMWFFRAPAIRFAWGWLLILLPLPFLLVLKKWLLQYSVSFKIALIAMLLGGLIRSSVASIIEFPNVTKHIIYPVAVDEGQIYRDLQWNGIHIKVAEDNFCRGLEPPCVPRHYHPGLMPRGNRVEDGFKITLKSED